MADTRLLYAGINGSVLGELPYQTLTYTETINAPGSLEVVMPLRPETVGAVQTVTNQTLTPAASTLWVERDQSVRFGALFWAPTATAETNTLQLRGNGPLSYLRRRSIRQTLTYNQVDQYSIARALVDYAQTDTGGDIGINTSGTDLAGVLRDRTYESWERRNAGQVLEQLAAVSNGFRFGFTPRRTATGFDWLMTFGPGSGRSTNHVFELGADAALLTYTESTDNLANQVDAAGAGEGPLRLIRSTSNPAALASYPLLDTVVTHVDVSVPSTLDEHAAFRLARGAAPAATVRLGLLPDTVPAPGSYGVGDVVTVRGSHGWLNVDGKFLITAIETSVSGGRESVTVTGVSWELFT